MTGRMEQFRSQAPDGGVQRPIGEQVQAEQRVQPVIGAGVGTGFGAERPVIPVTQVLRPPRTGPERLDNGVAAINNVAETQEPTRQEKIDAEIAAGKSPWQAHAEHSDQDGTKPFIVGFYQVYGKMVPLYSHSRHFNSERRTPAVRSGEREFQKKEINLLKISFEPILDEEPRVMQSADWEGLPEDFRAFLENGYRPVTTAVDLYALTEEEEAIVASSDSPTALHDLIQEKIAAAEDGYYVHYVGDPDEPRRGRHGSLMRIEDVELSQVKANIEGKEQGIEMKGIGVRTGGYGPRYIRTEGEVRAGAVTQNDAINEFNRLDEKIKNGGPAVAGIILHTADDGERLGTVFRFTPSTVRASFNGNEAFPKIDDPENVARVIEMYGQQLAEHIHGQPPKIMDRSAHPENMLVWGNGDSEFTDYADHLVFHDTRNPDFSYYEKLDRPGIRMLLGQYFAFAQEISGWGPDSQAQLNTAVNEAFAAKGFNVQIKPDDTASTAARKVWSNGGMAYAAYKARAEYGYSPQSAIYNLDYILRAPFSPARDASGELSAEAFADNMMNSSARASAAVEMLSAAIPDEARKDILLRGADLVKARQTRFEPDLVNEFLLILQEPSLPAEARQAVYDYTILTATTQYLQEVIPDIFLEEEMILFGAASSCPEEEKAAVVGALLDVDARRKTYDEIKEDPRDLFMLLSHPDSLKDLVTLKAYNKDVNSSKVPVDVI